MRRAVSAGVACAVVALAVAGCSGTDEDMPGLTASPTTTPAETPTPTPSHAPTSVAGTVADLSDPELGIVFEDVPELSGDEADVYNWVATYRVEYWRTLLDNEVSPGFAVFTAPEVQARMERIASANVEEGLEFDGTFHVSIDGISVDGDSAVGMACDDYRDVTITGPDGPRTLDEEGAAAPILLRVTLARGTTGAAGLWTVLGSEDVGTC